MPRNRCTILLIASSSVMMFGCATPDYFQESIQASEQRLHAQIDAQQRQIDAQRDLIFLLEKKIKELEKKAGGRQP